MDLQGAYGTYYPNYVTNGPSTNKSPNPSLTPNFGRVDRSLSLQMAGDTSRAGQVPLWNTTLGPAAYEFSNEQWANKLFFRWDFRLIAPCTGNYLFNVGGDGMFQAHNRNCGLLNIVVDAAFMSCSYPMALERENTELDVVFNRWGTVLRQRPARYLKRGMERPAHRLLQRHRNHASGM
jgi:hypothetical protein